MCGVVKKKSGSIQSKPYGDIHMREFLDDLKDPLASRHGCQINMYCIIHVVRSSSSPWLEKSINTLFFLALWSRYAALRLSTKIAKPPCKIKMSSSVVEETERLDFKTHEKHCFEKSWHGFCMPLVLKVEQMSPSPHRRVMLKAVIVAIGGSQQRSF